MADKIPSFKEEFDLIPVPTEKLDAIIFKIGTEKPAKKGPVWRKLAYGVGAAVMVLGILVGSASVSPAMAQVMSTIPLFGQIFKNFGDSGLQSVSENGLTELVGESKTVDGVTITLGEVYYDEARLTASFEIESEKPLEEYYFDIKYRFSENGIPRSWNLGYIYLQDSSPTKWVGIVYIDRFDNRWPMTELDLWLTFEGKQGERIQFSKQVVKKEFENKIEVVHTQQKDDFKFSMSELKWGAGGLLLFYESEYREKSGIMSAKVPIRFKVVDSSGKELEQLGGFQYGEQLFEPIDENVTELTIIPYADVNVLKHVNEYELITELQTYELEPFTVSIPK